MLVDVGCLQSQGSRPIKQATQTITTITKQSVTSNLPSMMVRIAARGWSLTLLRMQALELFRPIAKSCTRLSRLWRECQQLSVHVLHASSAVQLHLHEVRKTRRDWMAQQREDRALMMPLSPTAGCSLVRRPPTCHLHLQHRGRFGEVGDTQIGAIVALCST